MKNHEDKSYTKKSGNDDVRKNHSGGGNADYSKYDREHPHKTSGPGGGWSQVGQKSKEGADDARKSGVNNDRNPGKHPHQGK